MKNIQGSRFRRNCVAGAAAAALLAACGDSTVTNTTPEAAAASTTPAAPPVGAPPMGAAPPMDPGASAPPVTLPPIGESLAPLPAQFVRSYWNGVALADNNKRLAKASLLFAGRNPSATEASTVASGGDAALRTTVMSYLNGPGFDRFLEESAMTVFLTNRINTRGGDRGLSTTDFPMLANLAGQAGAFDAALRREPIELVKFIVKNNRPWTDVVQGNYTVVNPVLAQFVGAQLMNGETFADPANMNEWRVAQVPSRLGGMREHAGVLSTHAWLDSFPTTPTNRNRHRVNMLAKQFLATDVTALAARPIEDATRFNVPVMENPGCAICHDVIDPIAAGWQNWAENNRYRPFAVNAGPTALPASYRNTSYPNRAEGGEWYMAGDNWFRDGRAPGYAGLAMPGGVTGNPTALQWLGQRVASDPRFALGGVHFWYQAVYGRAPLKAPTDPASPQYQNQRVAYDAQKAEFDRMAAAFATSQFNVRTLLVELVMSPLFAAERVTGKNPAELADLGASVLWMPSMLNAKLQSQLGTGFAGFNNPYAGAGQNFGGFDGNNRTSRANAYTMVQASTMDTIALTMSCGWTQADFARAQADRLLFPRVAFTDTPATPQGLAAITANAQHLHAWLWQETLPATDAEVQRTVKLFTDVWNDRATASPTPVNCSLNAGNDPNYTGRAWAAVIAYMVGDKKFVFR